MTPFYVLGGVLAAWALVVTALGILRPGFPGEGFGERAVMGISAVLVAGAVVSGILTAGAVEHGPGESEAAAHAQDGQVVRLQADPSGDLRFSRRLIRVDPGEVTLVMENPSDVPHNIAFEGETVSEEGEVVERGGTSTVSADLPRGVYAFYCSVPGHREAGMRGDLVVR